MIAERCVTHHTSQLASWYSICAEQDICLCSSWYRLLVSDKQSADYIFSDYCDIPDEGGGDERELHQQIWEGVSHFL